MYKIKKGGTPPIPRSGKTKYPFKEMEVGEWILVPFSSQADASVVRAAASAAGKRLSRTFRVEKTTEGFKVWRV